MNKSTIKKILRPIMPAWVGRFRQQREFKRLGRKPPELMWKACAPCPERRTDGGTAKIGHRFFVMGGYQTIEHVLSVIDAFDLKKQKWTDRITMPAEVPQTHLGIGCDGNRFIYVVGGQLGPHCCPGVASCFVLDTRTKSWGQLPPLPEPRYSPAVKLWQGRLHVVAGNKADRGTPACDHWSMAVSEGKALENEWRKETAIPRGGPHRATALCHNAFYVLGGQDDDVMPLPNDLRYTCDPDSSSESAYPDSFALEAGSEQWKTLSPMPTAITHSESDVAINQYVVLVGGNEALHRLSDLIQVYDAQADRWRIAGRLPYFMKTLALYEQGWLYAITGQRSIGPDDLRPGEVLNTVWRAKFDPAAGWPS
jgi:hypothetical protein